MLRMTKANAEHHLHLLSIARSRYLIAKTKFSQTDNGAVGDASCHVQAETCLRDQTYWHKPSSTLLEAPQGHHRCTPHRTRVARYQDVSTAEPGKWTAFAVKCRGSLELYQP